MKKLGLLGIVFILSLSMFMSAMVQAKTVKIPYVDIVVTIRQDGSALIQEDRTIDFEGEFTFGFYEIPKKGFDSIKNITVAEGDQYYRQETSASKSPGTYTVTDTADVVRIDYYFHAVDEIRTFTIGYEVKDVVKVFQDYGEFYWMLQGTGWDYNINDFGAVINWEKPIPMDTYHIWAHGPLQGKFDKTDENSSFLQIENLPANTFVELRVLLSSTYFTAPKQEGTIYETVIAEETRLADAANAKREEAKIVDGIVEEMDQIESALDDEANEEPGKAQPSMRNGTIMKWLKMGLMIVGLAFLFLLLSFFFYKKKRSLS